MSLDSEHCVVMTTCASAADAARLAQGLVKDGLAACVQVTGVSSYYTWQGRVAEDYERLLLIKTRAARYPDVEAFIREHHDYEVPEVVCVPIKAGLPAYLEWIDGCT
ncbi:MAG: divalent-cation tolerance protein CutA [Gammaproteobacteria bacterium]|nr:divalent-cation tolerance protein CutA [Gammaproteobacteria bacterium]